MQRVMRLLRRAICWLFGHKPRRVRATYRDEEHNLYFRPVIKCARCGRREVA